MLSPFFTDKTSLQAEVVTVDATKRWTSFDDMYASSYSHINHFAQLVA